MKTIVVGMGNPVLTDDGVGMEVARQVRQAGNSDSDAEVVELCAGGLRIMEAVAGYDRAILVDAMTTGNWVPGTVRRLRMEEARLTRNGSCIHDTGLVEALEIGRLAGVRVPDDVRIVGIEVEDATTFGETLTAAVAAAVPEAVACVLELMRAKGGDHDEHRRVLLQLRN
ncbi:MAG: hydrogenase maturation protease [Lentisphaerae bacterium]|nr:hydrogenase maturation protease [Lentisphaerota bacterium]